MSRELRIHKLLTERLNPVELSVLNESPNHQVPVNSETHFRVVAVSNHFENQSRVVRHREVLKLLDDEFQNGLHALSLHLYTPSEWQKKAATAPASPACQHQREDT